MNYPVEDCIIIGAGLSGLAAAKSLDAAGLNVLLLDKGRRPGGRMASREFEGAMFDYGAQFLSARDPDFRRLIDGFLGTALVIPWFERLGETRYCSPLGMNALPEFLAASLRVICGVTVSAVRRDGKLWRVIAQDGTVYSGEALIVTAPLPQTLELVDIPLDVRSVLSAIEYHRCIALLAVLDGPSAIPEPGYLRLSQEPLQTVVDNRLKGLDSESVGVTILAGSVFSLEHWDTPREEAARLLLAAATPYLGSNVTHWRYHRWRFSQPVQTFTDRFFGLDQTPPLALAGDAFGGPRVEGAFLSGHAAANWLLTK